MSTTRRAALAGVGAVVGAPAWAQGWRPERALRMIVTYPPGGVTDIVGRIVADALARAHAAGGIFSESAARMTLLHGDSITLLPALAPDVVLVDPMHPPRGKSALVKKDMRVLRAIVGDDADQIDLMRAALASAQKRVVLKWPVRAPPMADLRPPSHQIIGKSTRYDVFMVVFSRES